MNAQTFDERFDEQLWRLQQATLLDGADPNNRRQQINRNTTKAALRALINEGMLEVIGPMYNLKDAEELPDPEMRDKMKLTMVGANGSKEKQLDRLKAVFGVEATQGDGS
jgi:hypothetical protein